MLLDDYRINGRRSIRRAEAAIKRLGEGFALSRAVEITADRVSEYIKTRLEAKAKPATVQKELAALNRMFTLAIRAKKLTLAQRPYIPTLEIHNTRTGFFEEPEFHAVLEHLAEHLKPVAEFMFWTGWRTSEVLGLQWRQIDFRHGVARLDADTTKNDDGRELPFAILPELGTVLTRQRSRTEALEISSGQIIPWVFHRDGARIKCFRGAWITACKAAGLAVTVDEGGKKIVRALRTPHDFRRTVVRRYERAGVARSVAMKLTGHKTESVYRRYAIVSPADLREALAKVAALSQATVRQPRKVTSIEGARTHSRKVPAKSVRLDGLTAEARLV